MHITDRVDKKAYLQYRLEVKNRLNVQYKVRVKAGGKGEGMTRSIAERSGRRGRKKVKGRMEREGIKEWRISLALLLHFSSLKFF